MNVKFKQITPSDVYAPYRKEILSQFHKYGIETKSIVPTGNDFIDCFVDLICKHGWSDASTYAKMMGIESLAFSHTVITLTGSTPKQWITWFIIEAAAEMLECTDLELADIANRLGISSYPILSNIFFKHKKMRPSDWKWKYYRLKQKTILVM